MPPLENSAYVVQVIHQINFGALEGKRYSELNEASVAEGFKEVTEKQLIDANFEKLNSCVASLKFLFALLCIRVSKTELKIVCHSYKNFKCTVHNKFFELNLYRKNPVNKHHWRANIARPASNIDLLKSDKNGPETPPAHIIGSTALVDVKTEVVNDGSSDGDEGKNEVARESDRKIENSVDTPYMDNYFQMILLRV